jgi:hypothetical protein
MAELCPNHPAPEQSIESRTPAPHGHRVRDPLSLRDQGPDSMTRNNMLYLAVGALAVVAAILAWNLYQAKKQPDGVQINIGPGGLTIEKK